MPKFNVGDHVKVPNSKTHVPMDLLGREGTITVNRMWERDKADDPWKSFYAVQFTGEEWSRPAAEDWLESAQ